MFIAKCKNLKSKNVLQRANIVEKIIFDQGFEVTRLNKKKIERFLAIYFNAGMNGDLIPDIDGERYFERKTVDEEI